MSSQPRRYMSKRQRPCDFCRSRKTACRMDQAPPCRLCVLHGRQCTFIEAAAPRKRQVPVDDGVMLDGTVAQGPLSSQTHRTMAASSPEPLQLSQISPEIPAEHPSEDSNMNFVENFNFDTTQSEFEAMFRSPRPPSTPSAKTSQAATPRPAGPLRETEYPAGANPQVLGLTSDMDPLLLRYYRFDDNGMFGFKELAIHSIQDSPIPCQFLVSQQSLFARRREETGLGNRHGAEIQPLEKVISVEIGTRLMRLFCQFIQPQWPILSEDQIQDSSTSPAHLLAAIYAISLPFAVHDDKLSVDVAYDKPPYPSLSQIIDRELAYEIHSPSLAVIQTLLLLVLRPSSDPLVADASYRWDLMGKLVSCATTLGLHLDPSSWSIASWQKSHRRRLSFFIFAVDKWLACSLGRPPLIHHDNWLVASLKQGGLDESGLQEQEEAQLINFSTITTVLDSSLSKLYSIRAINELSTYQSKTWMVTQSLLQHLNEEPGVSVSESTFARLGRLYGQLIVLRAEIRSWLTQKPALESHSNDVPNHAQTSRQSMRKCTHALSDIIRGLNPDIDSVFWPSWTQFVFSSVCFTLMTMVVSSPDFDEACSWIVDLQSTRKSLRLKVASFPFLRLGLLRIDALFWRGISNVFHLEPHVAEAFKAME
ncbi:putative transcriptional regulatory protein C25B8.11 [Colletotrichum chlorophyti]|uniref:Putative transcriptional regulatory protein C25B8.11 n=1 Tax=Colletotrichum chlorophyti TaxID=708187 RepID=A0A1Q8RYS1_9PEZI|nr:putative transcriptional regulatory protein C25B8.11 [Colletotrichum chlorophyti]